MRPSCFPLLAPYDSSVTNDHKALSRDERLRIQRLGGFITENGRVCGNIAGVPCLPVDVFPYFSFAINWRQSLSTLRVTSA